MRQTKLKILVMEYPYCRSSLPGESIREHSQTRVRATVSTVLNWWASVSYADCRSMATQTGAVQSKISLSFCSGVWQELYIQ